ncbi:hypothetical protein BOX15_Mlig001055g1, partial [Macrostomum lignano]
AATMEPQQQQQPQSSRTDDWDSEDAFQRDRTRLWESLNSRKRLDVDSNGLHRLLSFVENPTFKEASFLRRQKSGLRPLPQASESDRVALKREDTLPMPAEAEAEPSQPRRKIVLGLRPAYTAPLPPIQRSGVGSFHRMLGGAPIGRGEALRLRQVTFGNAVHPFCKEWRRAHFTFQEASGPHPYGLLAHRDATRALVLCVQAQLLRRLLFPADCPDRFRTHLLAVEPARRPTLLAESLADILWRAGEGRRAALAAPSSECHVPSDDQYREDGFTERLHLFYFTSLPELLDGLRRLENYFTSPSHPGCLLLLYCLVLSRGFLRIQADWDGAPKASLLNDNEELATPGFTLLLTGAACRFLHNGCQLADPETGAPLPAPRTGLAQRPDVGLLQTRPAVGSMLRSPRFPIWLVRRRGQAGLLFSTHSRLMEHWRSETAFHLYYYTGLASQFRPCRLSVDTRQARVATARKSARRRYRQMLQEQQQLEQLQQQRRRSSRQSQPPPQPTEPVGNDESTDEEDQHPQHHQRGHLLERLIQTRWPGAQVEWPQGVTPFF